MPPHTLSKTRYLSALQCHKRLWWEVYEPDAPELKPDENTLVVFDNGRAVGEAARKQVPDGVLIIGKASEGSIKVDRTRAAIAAGAKVIYEATFAHAQVYVSIDILEQVDGGYRITEVKSTVEAKEEHLLDIGIQHWVALNTQLPVVASHLMHLNRECRAPDLSNLFARADLTTEVTNVLPMIPAQVKGMLRVLEGPLPEVAIGDHCDEPRACPFKERCWPAPVPHQIENLRGLSAKKRALLQEVGAETIHQIPPDFELTDFQAIQRQAVTAGRMLVDPGLREALRVFEGERVAFLDFETVSPAIPIWNGTGPYAQLPAQFSCDVQDSDGTVEHFDWIAVGPEDPRPGIAHAVVDACRGASVVVAFNATFEKKCLKGLAEAVPAFSAQLLGVVDRMQDLAEPVRKGLVYHPDFNGSYSLKVVIPVLLPALAYDDLAVSDGITASNRLLALMLGMQAPGSVEAAQVKDELLAYCGRDTVVMVELLRYLKAL